MPLIVVADLPSFDTGQYEGCEFLMRQGGATLTIKLAGLPSIALSFTKVRWHQFTALYNCSPEQVKSAYFKLVECSQSSELARFIAGDASSSRTYGNLHHYRIFLDETGCHELFAESASVV